MPLALQPLIDTPADPARGVQGGVWALVDRRPSRTLVRGLLLVDDLDHRYADRADVRRLRRSVLGYRRPITDDCPHSDLQRARDRLIEVRYRWGLQSNPNRPAHLDQAVGYRIAQPARQLGRRAQLPPAARRLIGDTRLNDLLGRFEWVDLDDRTDIELLNVEVAGPMHLPGSPSFRAATSLISGSASGQNITVPTGTAADDQVLAHLGQRQARFPTWTNMAFTTIQVLTQGSHDSNFHRRTWVGTETGTIDYTTATSTGVTTVVASYQGVGAFRTHQGQGNTTAANTHDTPTLTGVSGELLVHTINGEDTQWAYDQPSASITLDAIAEQSASNRCHVVFAHEVLSGAGTTTAFTIDITGATTAQWIGFQVAIDSGVAAIDIDPTVIVVPVVVPAPTVDTDPFAGAPTAIAVPVVLPAPTVSNAPQVFPTARPVPIVVPAPALAGGDANIAPTPIVVPVGNPTPIVSTLPPVTPTARAIGITVPAPTITAGAATITPTPIAVPVNVVTPASIGTQSPVHADPLIEIAWGVNVLDEPRDQRSQWTAFDDDTSGPSWLNLALGAANQTDLSQRLIIAQCQIGSDDFGYYQQARYKVLMSVGDALSDDRQLLVLYDYALQRLGIAWYPLGTLASEELVWAASRVPFGSGGEPQVGYRKLWVRVVLDTDSDTGSPGTQHLVLFHYTYLERPTDATPLGLDGKLKPRERWETAGAVQVQPGSSTSVHQPGFAASKGAALRFGLGQFSPNSPVSVGRGGESLDQYAFELRETNDDRADLLAGTATTNLRVRGAIADADYPVDEWTDQATGIDWTVFQAPTFKPTDWDDVTDDVWLGEGGDGELTITRGRELVLSQPTPGRWAMQLFNPQRKYERGYTGGPLGALVVPTTHARVRTAYSAVRYPIVRGYAKDFVPVWPTAGDRALVDVPCIDGSRALQLTEVPDDATDTHKRLGAAAHWPLDELAGSTFAESSGLADSTLTKEGAGSAGIVNADNVWACGGVAAGPTFDGFDVQRIANSSGIPAALQLDGPMSISMWVYLPEQRAGVSNLERQFDLLVAAEDLTGLQRWGYGLRANYINVAGWQFEVLIGANSYSIVRPTTFGSSFQPYPPTNRWLFVTYVRVSNDQHELYIDGVLFGRTFVVNESESPADLTGGTAVIYSGSRYGAPDAPAHADVAVAHIAVWDRVITVDDIAQLRRANLGDLVAERTDQRINRLLDCAGWASARRRIAEGSETCPQIDPTSLGFPEYQSLVADTAKAEGLGAAFYFDAQGDATFEGRTTRSAPDRPTARVNDDSLSTVEGWYRRVQPADAELVLRTQAAATAQGSLERQVFVNEVQAARFGPRRASLGVLQVDDDATAFEHAVNTAARLGVPRDALAAIVLDPYLRAGDDGFRKAYWESMLQLELGVAFETTRNPPDRLALVSPRRYFSFVERIEHRIGKRSHLVTVGLGDQAHSGVWVLGTSQLGADTALAFDGDTST